jgi:plastocyanin domain-containing protein
MDTQEILVLVGGVLLIAFVIWYFFFSERERATAAVGSSGVQHIKITVKGGYTPDVVVVKKGVPVELDFYRDEVSSYTEQVVFGDFGISRMLPAFRETPVMFTPDKEGEYTFNCGMNMVRGKLIVEA